MIKISGGTLIIAIPCKDGLVVSADKRETNDAWGTSRDDVEKIHKLSSFAAFGIAGYPRFFEKDRFTRQVKVVCDVREVVKEFYSSRDTKFISQTWDELGFHLQNHSNNFLSTHDFEKELQILRTQGDWLYHLPFWYLTPDGQIGSTMLKMKYRERDLRYFISETPQESFQRAECFSYGHEAVLRELKTGNNNRFDEYRNNHAIMRFLNDSPPAENVKTSEALAASEKLITITSNWIPRVGFSIDSILIHKQKGVEIISASTTLANERTQEKKEIRKQKS